MYIATTHSKYQLTNLFDIRINRGFAVQYS